MRTAPVTPAPSRYRAELTPHTPPGHNLMPTGCGTTDCSSRARMIAPDTRGHRAAATSCGPHDSTGQTPLGRSSPPANSRMVESRLRQRYPGEDAFGLAPARADRTAEIQRQLSHQRTFPQRGHGKLRQGDRQEAERGCSRGSIQRGPVEGTCRPHRAGVGRRRENRTGEATRRRAHCTDETKCGPGAHSAR